MVDQTDLDAVEAAITAETKLVWVETPTNPTLKVIDVPAIVARARGAFVAVDNTFATPVYQRPLELGADAAVHSTTKYLGGHSDAVGGAVIVREEAAHQAVRFVQNSIGAVPGPLDAFLTHRGLRTLPLRMAAHTDNARVVVAWLEGVEGVYDIRWPGLSGMVSFRHPDAAGIVSRTKVFTLAESLGGVESLIEVPQAMTHQSVEGSGAAVPADLVRLSCGIEAAEDLVEDLEQAMGVG
jgi:cystathionine gamma-synthase